MFIKNEIDKVEAGETITQQDLPEGSGVLAETVGGYSMEDNSSEYYGENQNPYSEQAIPQQNSPMNNNNSYEQQPAESNSGSQEAIPATAEPETPSNNEAGESSDHSGNTGNNGNAESGSETGTDGAAG